MKKMCVYIQTHKTLVIEFADTDDVREHQEMFAGKVYIEKPLIAAITYPFGYGITNWKDVEEAQRLRLMDIGALSDNHSFIKFGHRDGEELQKAISLLATKDEHGNKELMALGEFVMWLGEMGFTLVPKEELESVEVDA